MAREALSVIAGEAEGRTISLNGELVIGRSVPELADLAVDTQLSRVHARVWRNRDGSLMIEDLGSRNGTYVNGSRIARPTSLAPGDEVRIGRTTMELVANGAGEAPAYDALVEPEPEQASPEPASPEPRTRRLPWTAIAAALTALVAGGAIGALATHERRGPTTTDTLVVTHTVQPPPARSRLSVPRRPVALPSQAAAGVVPAAFVHAFCGRGGSAPRGICVCAYDELIRREPYATVAADLANTRGRVPQPVASAARACGAG